MWQRFTGSAKKAIYAAQVEAQGLGCNHVSTEHLLLGLFHDPANVACQVLQGLRVSPETVRSELEPTLQRGSSPVSQDMNLTPRAKRVIDLAYVESRHLDNNYIGTEHLLLGLILEQGGLAGLALAKCGVHLEEARQQVTRIQEGNISSKAEGFSYPRGSSTQVQNPERGPVERGIGRFIGLITGAGRKRR